jgi:hypothetical protein
VCDNFCFAPVKPYEIVFFQVIKDRQKREEDKKKRKELKKAGSGGKNSRKDK